MSHFRSFTAIFLLAASILMQQILYTRLFSVTLFYHYSFLVIAITMLGLTLGALAVHFAKIRGWNFKNLEVTGYLSIAAALCTSGALYAQIHSRMLTQEGLNSVLLNASLLLPGFTLSGAAITILLMRDMRMTNRMYAADLCGAALGCVMVLFLLDSVGVLLSLLTTVFILMFAGCISLASGSRARQYSMYLLTAIGVFLATGIFYSNTGDPFLKLNFVRGMELEELEFEAWNSYSQVIIPKNNSQKNIIIDQGASTLLYNWNGDVSVLSWLRNSLANAAYNMRHIEKTLVIGVGGGVDIYSALAFGTPKVVGVEMNRTNYKLITDIYADYSGNLNKKPGVTLLNAEARSFVEQTQQRFDLIQISMIDTWAATAAGAFAMAENSLYTVEAWHSFLQKLTPNGVLSLTRWYNAKNHPGELYRMLSMARIVLLEEGIARPQDHVAALSEAGRVTLLISKSPITQIEISHLSTIPNKTLILSPTYTANKELSMLLANPDVSEISSLIKADLTPATDNRPFFFNMLSLKQLMNENIKSVVGNMNAFNLQAVHFLGFIFIVILSFVALLLIITIRSAIKSAPNIPLVKIVGNITYFLMIGFGFMLVELALLQQLTLFLGHPSYSLSVVLTVLLLSSGAGSLLRQLLKSPQRQVCCLAVLFIFLLMEALLNPFILSHARAWDEASRIAIATVLIVPCGILMGTAMPLGIHYARMSKTEQLAPWLWAMNGAASVLASVSGLCISLFFGIEATFLSGAACYGIVALLYWRRTFSSRVSAE